MPALSTFLFFLLLSLWFVFSTLDGPGPLPGTWQERSVSGALTPAAGTAVNSIRLEVAHVAKPPRVEGLIWQIEGSFGQAFLGCWKAATVMV